jgi:hypothetical protein
MVAPAVHGGDDGGFHCAPSQQCPAADSIASAARRAAPSTCQRRHLCGSPAWA